MTEISKALRKARLCVSNQPITVGPVLECHSGLRQGERMAEESANFSQPIVVYDELDEGEEETYVVYAGIRDVYDLLAAIAEAEGRTVNVTDGDGDDDE